MNEPHQRAQSGQLKNISRRTRSEPIILQSSNSSVVFTGIKSSVALEETLLQDEIDCYDQTPSTLTKIHVSLLTKMCEGYGIRNSDCIDTEWRKTWNIGRWRVGSEISLSINIMQPNISSSWVTLLCPHNSKIEDVATKYREENLAKSSVSMNRTGKGYQLQGRWSITITNDLVSLGLIDESDYIVTSVNIGQVRIFCWMLIGTTSKYLCMLTKDSVEMLMKFIPPWCSDLQEKTSASDISLRIKNPTKVNDSTQMVITTKGRVRYQGSIDSISKLPEALTIAIKSIMKSKSSYLFLNSLEYRDVVMN
jgi:hypothetical protein